MKISKGKRILQFGVVFVVLALAIGCVRLPPPDLSNPIVKVAVLPIQNYTPDMDAPGWIRSGISEMIPSRYYMVIPNDQVDQILREKMGVTLGGQLDYRNLAIGAPLPSVVGQTLGVDGLMYCNLEDFQNLITGIYNRRKVKAKCSLVNAKTSAVVWEKEEEVSNSELNLSLSGAIDALKQKVVVALVNSALRSNPLPVETAGVIEQMKNTLPSGPVMDATEQAAQAPQAEPIAKK